MMFLMHNLFLISIFKVYCDCAPTSTESEFSPDDFKCALPDVRTLDNDFNITRFQRDFSKISEVKFPGLIGPLNERLICKIKCIDGEWVGPLCSPTADGRFQPILRECESLYKNNHSTLMISYKNSTIDRHASFPHGSTVTTRCKQFGLYKLKGDGVLRCENGEWIPRLPECVPTTLLTNFTGDAPPTIQYKVVSGSVSVEPSGELLVFPETCLQLDCITKRAAGEPEWSWTQMLGQHSTGWSPDEEERQTHYRLSLNKMSSSHSDQYTCTSAEGQTNTIHVKVVNVVCPRVNMTSDRLILFEEGVRLGQSIHFSCQPGYHLNGSDVITCTGSGSWSQSPPKCEQTFCPVLKFLGPHVSLVEYNASFGGRAVFQCSWGYRLFGTPGIECEHDGKWSGEPPICEAIYCPVPLIPQNGKLLTQPSSRDGKYRVGDLLIYGCNAHHQLLGETSIVCTESGFWSHPPPFCTTPTQVTKIDTIYMDNTTLIHVEGGDDS